MKRTYRFVEPSGFVVSTIDGQPHAIPVLPGILKHPTIEELGGLLADPLVARRYTQEALRKAPWSALRRFPRALLLASLEEARLREGRRAALAMLLAP